MKNSLITYVKNIFSYEPKEQYHFSIPETNEEIKNNPNSLETSNIETPKEVFPSIGVNLEAITSRFNTLINSDIILREFTLLARNRQYKALLFFIDGMVDSQLINNNVLEALMLRNRANIFDNEIEQVVSEAKTNNITVRKVRKFNLEDYIFDCLLPQNNVQKVSTFDEAFSRG